MKTITITAELPEHEAMALAQFLKRASFSTWREVSISEDEAYDMRNGSDKVAKALAEQGFNPR